MRSFEAESEDENTGIWGKTDRKRKSRGVQPIRTCLVLFHQPSLRKLASSSPFPVSHLFLSFASKEAIRESERGRDTHTQWERETHWAVRGALRKQALQFALLFDFLSLLFLTTSASSSSSSLVFELRKSFMFLMCEVLATCCWVETQSHWTTLKLIRDSSPGNKAVRTTITTALINCYNKNLCWCFTDASPCNKEERRVML